MKTVERIAGPVRLTLASGATKVVFVMNADPIGVWLSEDTFVPWAAIDQVVVNP